MDFKNIKKIIIVFFFNILCVAAFGHQQQHSLSLELAGNHGYFGINYSKLIFQKNNHHFNASIGLGASRMTDFDKLINPDFTIPLLVQYNYRLHKKHQVFFATGTTFLSFIDLNTAAEKERVSKYLFTNNLGYTYQFNDQWSISGYGILQINQNIAPWFGIKINKQW